jgi:DNA-binding transcriptional ArsR family regulator
LQFRLRRNFHLRQITRNSSITCAFVRSCLALQTRECSVSALTEALASSQPNVSKHLKILADAELIARRQEGNTVCYAVADQSIFGLCEAVCIPLRENLDAQAEALG